MRLVARALTRDQANAYIVAHHRHHKRVTGHRFIVGAVLAGELVGVMVAGRPRARRIDQYAHVEVSRLCTEGEPNVCSFLYSRAARVARELGFASCFTAILESESGASLRAAGWVYAYTTKGGTQDRPSRPRVDKSPTTPKSIWCPAWCLETVRELNAEQSAKVA
ncbi:MAG TPA: XF1762 family protein [Kofleriaceae bacterium]|nr:XF1762 family protein [Kofleriaceae bacterium]